MKQDYTKLKLSELLQLCSERGLKGCSALKKAGIIQRLYESDNGGVLIESEYVLQPMITYIGNKRKLVPWIMEVIEEIRGELGVGIGDLKILDGFAGSGVVSRALMAVCSHLHSNDMEYYSYVLLRCFLETPSEEQRGEIDLCFEAMSELVSDYEGFITRLYSPRDTSLPQEGERCFYTRENALIIDTYMKFIFNEVREDIRDYLLGPLLIKASINVNTAGVFRGFYKKDGVGHFGGVGENALERILAPIQLVKPIWSSSSCKAVCHNIDIHRLIEEFEDKEFDIIYLDPPYNEHPYGSNYFMLNLIALCEEPTEFSKVSGIPKVWNKSTFNGRGSAFESMLDLVEKCLKKGRCVLISYNNEGLVSVEEWEDIFKRVGCRVRKYEKEYDTYHGSRNLAGRNKKVVEILYALF